MLTTLALTVALATASSQSNGAPDRPISRHLERTVFTATSLPTTAPLPQAGSRDSLKNGAAIGAVVLGAVTGVSIGYLCHTFNDDDDLPCWQPVLLWTAAGAGAGALIGAGIDALFQRRLVVRAAVTF